MPPPIDPFFFLASDRDDTWLAEYVYHNLSQLPLKLTTAQSILISILIQTKVQPSVCLEDLSIGIIMSMA